MQTGRIVSACFSSDMRILSVFAEDSANDAAAVRLFMVSILTITVNSSSL